MLEAMTDGYASAFEHDFDEEDDNPGPLDSVRLVMQRAAKRTWKHLARERLEDTTPTIPLGRRFWEVTDEERAGLRTIFTDHVVAGLVTMVESRDDDTGVTLACSSLGLLRYAALLEVDGADGDISELCLMDVKEATQSAAPPTGSDMPGDHARRVVEGARHISPFLGERMRGVVGCGHRPDGGPRALLPRTLPPLRPGRFHLGQVPVRAEVDASPAA
jgi:uncharacterized protein (DUF2252 family)